MTWAHVQARALAYDATRDPNVLRGLTPQGVLKVLYAANKLEAERDQLRLRDPEVRRLREMFHRDQAGLA